MKTGINLHPILFLALLFLFLSCKKEYEFPDITQEGKGTFGCKIDGRVYVPRTEYGTLANYLISRLDLSDDGMINMAIVVSRDKTESMGSLLINYEGDLLGLKPGTYTMNDPAMDFGKYSAVYDYQGVIYQTQESQPSEIVITRFDCGEGIISGTFKFTLSQPESGKQIEVTEGRFDIEIEEYHLTEFRYSGHPAQHAIG